MSFVIEILRKLEDRGRKPSVHPAFFKREKKRKRKRNLALFILLPLLIAILSAGTFLITNQHIMGETYTGPDTKQARKQPYRNETTTETSQASGPEKDADQSVEVAPVKTVKKPFESGPVRANEKVGVEKLVSDMKIEEQSSPKVSERAQQSSFSKLAFLADRAFRNGNLFMSMEYYERALGIKQDTQVAKNLIVVYTRLGLFRRAMSLISMLREGDLAYTYLVELAASGEVERAMKEGERLKNLDRRGKVFFALGYIYEISGDIHRALLNYETAYRRNPTDQYISVNYARILERVGRLKEAYKVYTYLSSAATDPKIKLLASERTSYLRSLGFYHEER